MKVEALGNEAGLCPLMAHADDEQFDLSLFGVRGVVDSLVEILNFLFGEVDFDDRLNGG